MKFFIGTSSVRLPQTSIWVVHHDGTCDSFKRSWLEGEQDLIESWYKAISESDNVCLKALVNKQPNGTYMVGNETVSVFDVTILHREEIDDNWDKIKC